MCWKKDVVQAPTEDPESPPCPGRGIEPGLECEILHAGTAPRRQVFGARGSSASAGGDVPPSKVLRAPRPAACVLACPSVLVP